MLSFHNDGEFSLLRVALEGLIMLKDLCDAATLTWKRLNTTGSKLRLWVTMAKVRRTLIHHLKAEVRERYNHNLLKSVTWANIYSPDRSQTLRFFHILLLWKHYFVHLHSSDKTQALNPIKRCQGARGMDQHGQHCDGGSLRAGLQQKRALATAAARR